MGDAAINLSTAALLRRLQPATVRISGRFFRQDAEFYARHQIEVVPPAIRFAPAGEYGPVRRFSEVFISGARCALVLAPSLVGLRGTSRWLAERWGGDGIAAVFDADTVVLAGGGYLFSARTRRLRHAASLLHNLASIWIARAAGKRLLMMPQSIGPLTGFFDRWIVGKTLTHVGSVVLRERISYQDLVGLIGEDQLSVCPDVALYGWDAVSGDTPRQQSAHSGRPRVGIVVMDWTWARPRGPTLLGRYLGELVKLIAHLRALEAEVVLLACSRVPGQDDVIVAERVARMTGSPEPIVTDVSDPDTFRSVVALMDVLVGTRLHACLLALSLGVPAISLGYQPKSRGSYQMLGLDPLYHDVETFDALALSVQIASILSQRDGWLSQVRQATAKAKVGIEDLYRRMAVPAGRPSK